MRALGVALLLGASLVACAPKKPPIDCTAIFVQPGTHGMPPGKGIWTPRDILATKSDDELGRWWERCQGRIVVLKDPSPKPGTPQDVHIPVTLHLDDCTFDAPWEAGDPWIWPRADIDVNFEVNN